MEALRLRELETALAASTNKPTAELLQLAANVPPGIMDQGTMYRSPAAYRTAPVTTNSTAATSRTAFEPIFNEDVVVVQPASTAVVPQPTPAPVSYQEESPEVKAARAAFLKAFEAALARAAPTTTAAPRVLAASLAAGAVGPAAVRTPSAPSFGAPYAPVGLPLGGGYLNFLG